MKEQHRLKTEIPDLDVLIRYLLGGLSSHERSEVARHYFEAGDLFDELLDVENYLVDQYARGRLSEDERRAFEGYLRRLPDGRQKLAVSIALMETTDEEKEKAKQVLSRYASESVSSRPSVVWSALKRPVKASYAIAASAALIVIGLLLLLQILHLRATNDQIRTRIDKLESEKESLEEGGLSADASNERIRQLEEQLNVEQQVNEAQARRLARVQPTTPVVASWNLTSAMRSQNTPDSVTLPRSAQFVLINVPIEPDEHLSSYHAIIQTTTGEQRREIAGLRSNKGTKTVSLRLPAGHFMETTYKLTIVGEDQDGLVLARDYYFSVARD
jgi:hypothetical protein